MHQENSMSVPKLGRHLTAYKTKRYTFGHSSHYVYAALVSERCYDGRFVIATINK